MTLAAQSEPTDLSFALAPLQQVAASLRRARAGWLPTRDERTLLFGMMPRLGPAVFPQLLRSLGSDSDEEAHWAGQLLRQASVPEVAVRLRKLLTTPQHPDSVKARALAIFAGVGLSPTSGRRTGRPRRFHRSLGFRAAPNHSVGRRPGADYQRSANSSAYRGASAGTTGGGLSRW